mgnify:CR=1 FL=1
MIQGGPTPVVFKLFLFLLLLIAALQYRLWFGDGGIEEYRETQGRIEDLKREGELRRIRNAAVSADVGDLRDGTDAIEERARHDLGLVKPGETYVQIYEDMEGPAPVVKSDGSLHTTSPNTKGHTKPKPKGKSPKPGAPSPTP